MIATSFLFFKQLSENAIYVAIFLTPLLGLLIIIQNIKPWKKKIYSTIITITSWLIAGACSFLITNQFSSFIFALSGLILTLIIQQLNKNYFVTGYMFLTNTLLMVVFGTIWGVTFILTENLSMATQLLMSIGLITLSVSLPLGLITLLPVNSFLFRKKWLRPSTPMASSDILANFLPKVSLHLPCYEEPPEIVIASLKALSELDYPNFEVIVIDNNTKDEKLWMPVKDYCEQLGNNFRFYHVSPLKGAKAGALNFALHHTDDKAEIIGVIDADYQVNSNFLKDLIGFFKDEKIGFVQTPHDYRDWEENRFIRNCYWEYLPAYKLKIACLNEWVASYIIGTMCLIKKNALEEAGGWSEWCLTEDAECGLRIHALGYTSIYISQTYGRGIVPESFYDYKKQRLRWTIGPIQQLKKHWRLLLPSRLSTPSKLSNWQRILEFSHCLRELSPIANILILPIGFATLGSIIYHQEIIIIPQIVWTSMLVTMPALLAISWLTYRLAGCKSILDIIGASIATQSLTHVRLVGSIIGLFGNLPWQRTNKFKLEPSGIKALLSTKSEISLAIIFFALSYIFSTKASISPPDIFFLSSLGMFTAGIRYLAAPVMVIFSEIALNRAKKLLPIKKELPSQENSFSNL